MFEYEDRMCGSCGQRWSALTFWDADVVCGDCATAQYREQLRQINDAKPYSVESIGGACPTQAEGLTATGRPYYFRARHGEWTLEVGQHGWPVGLRKWPRDGEIVAGGDDPSHGSMSDDAVLSILDEHLADR